MSLIDSFGSGKYPSCCGKRVYLRTYPSSVGIRLSLDTTSPATRNGGFTSPWLKSNVLFAVITLPVRLVSSYSTVNGSKRVMFSILRSFLILIDIGLVIRLSYGLPTQHAISAPRFLFSASWPPPMAIKSPSWSAFS